MNKWFSTIVPWHIDVLQIVLKCAVWVWGRIIIGRATGECEPPSGCMGYLVSCQKLMMCFDNRAFSMCHEMKNVENHYFRGIGGSWKVPSLGASASYVLYLWNKLVLFSFGSEHEGELCVLLEIWSFFRGGSSNHKLNNLSVNNIECLYPEKSKTFR